MRFTGAKVLLIATASPAEEVELCLKLPHRSLYSRLERKPKLQCMLGYKQYGIGGFQIEEMKAADVSERVWKRKQIRQMQPSNNEVEW